MRYDPDDPNWTVNWPKLFTILGKFLLVVFFSLWLQSVVKPHTDAMVSAVFRMFR